MPPCDLSQHPAVDKGRPGHQQANSCDEGAGSDVPERQCQSVKRISSAHETRRSPRSAARRRSRAIGR
jgi:hypothetical protein